MSEKLVQIFTDLDRKEIVPLNHVSSEKLIKNLVDTKNEYILLVGALFDQF